MCVVWETNTVDAEERGVPSRHHETTYPPTPATAGQRIPAAVGVTEMSVGTPARVGEKAPERTAGRVSARNGALADPSTTTPPLVASTSKMWTDEGANPDTRPRLWATAIERSAEGASPSGRHDTLYPSAPAASGQRNSTLDEVISVASNDPTRPSRAATGDPAATPPANTTIARAHHTTLRGPAPRRPRGTAPRVPSATLGPTERFAEPRRTRGTAPRVPCDLESLTSCP